jgi:cysteinyl-tRNA synthetase
MPLTLYNTLTKRPEAFTPRDPGHVTFYTCGPTVYDDAHVGNFRSFLAADVLRRFVESPLCELTGPDGKPHRGPRRVTHVMNITDVGHMTDDADGGENGEDRMAVAGKRLAEAKKSGALPAGVEIDPKDPYTIAKFYASRFLEDARTLGLKVALDQQTDPTVMPFATANVDGMIEVVKTLIARGHAYAAGPAGSRAVYFRVKSFENYGRLSGNTLDHLREGEGGRVSADNQSTKEHPADFLLWKEDASHIMKWDSPWGAGYPGWHIECTVMAARRLIDGGLAAALATPGASPAQIDLHSGGEDNIFPHHECEIAQSACAFCASPAGGTFARMWFHPRHLFIEGQKMSKSKGNFYTARDLFAGNASRQPFEPATIRLELIKTHYRTNANFTLQGLADSARIVERWRRVAAGTGANPAGQGLRDEAKLRFADAMHADLNVAAAIAEVNKFASGVQNPGTEDAALMREFDAVLGVLEREKAKAVATGRAVYLAGATPSDAIEALLEKRAAAKAAKDFKASDAIRDELAAMGLAIKDVAGGKVEVSRK